MSLQWRTVKIFISSTFRDMHAERDYLTKQVFPDLKAQLEKKNLHLVEVDLRWGITEEQLQKGQVVDICLQEIERCRPFFVCLLGGRYGSIMPGYESSVTELEIEHGALLPLRQGNKEMAAFFYFRETDFREQLSKEQKAVYFDTNEEGKICTDLQQKQNELRSKITKTHYPTHYYYPKWDNSLYTPENSNDQESETWNQKTTQGRLCGLEEFGELLKKDLMSAIDKEYPIEIEEEDPLLREQKLHMIFAELRSHVYIGRTNQLQQLDKYIQKDTPWPIVVLGSPGSGKSSFIAKWYKNHPISYPQDWVWIHFVGATPESTQVNHLLTRLCHDIKKEFNLDAEIPNNTKDLTKTLQNFLLQISKYERRIIIAIDSLNQLDPTENAHLLEWLPQFLEKNVRIILSTLPGTCLDSLKIRTTEELSLKAMEEKDKHTFITETLKLYGKTLSEEQQNTLLANSATDIPLFMKVALEEIRLFGSYEKLTARIKNLPGDVAALFEQVLERLEIEQGAFLVRQMLSFLACSRYGLTEYEILQLLKSETGNPLPAFHWAKLYRSLKPYMFQHGTLYNFSHNQLREAVARRYLTVDYSLSCHSQLADFFSCTANNRKIQEYPYHLLHSKRFEDLIVIMMDLNFLNELTADDDYNDAILYWVALEKKASPYMHYMESLKNIEDQETIETANHFRRVATLLGKLGYYKEQIPLLDNNLHILQQLYGESHLEIATTYQLLAGAWNSQGEYDKAKKYYFCTLQTREKELGKDSLGVAETYHEIAYVYWKKADYETSISYYQKALAIRLQKLGERTPEVASTHNDLALVYWQQKQYDKAIENYKIAESIQREKLGQDHPELASTYNNIALVYSSQEDYSQAIEYYEKALHIKMKKLGHLHPDVATVYNNIADIYQTQHEFIKAEACYQKALEICQQKLGDEHPVAATIYNNLGFMHSEQNNNDRAMFFYQKTLKISQQKLEANHPQIAIIYNNIAHLYKENQPDRTLEYYEKALDILTSKYESNHTEIAKQSNRMAQFYLEQNRLQEAIQYFEKALLIYLKNQDPNLSVAHFNLGAVLYKTIQMDKARFHLEQAYQKFVDELGEGHPNTQVCQEILEDIRGRE